MAAPKDPAFQHPLVRRTPRILVLGGVYTLAGVALLAVSGVSLAAAAMVGFGVLLTALGLRQRRIAGALPRNNTVYDLIARGRFDEAQALLDATPASQRAGLLGVAFLSQRMYLAFVRGDFPEAARQAEEALAASSSLSGAQAELLVPGLRSYRALSLAACGESAEALAEAARAEALPAIRPQHRGGAALARAVVAARANDRAALAEALVLLQPTVGALNARESMLARTLQRYAASPAGGAYRVTAADHGASSPERDWITAVVPNATAFAPRVNAAPPEVSPQALPAATDAARAKVAADLQRAKEAAKRGRWLPVAAAVALVVGTLAAVFVWGRTVAAPVFPGVLLAAGLGWAVYLVQQSRRGAREIRDALATHATQPEVAEALLARAAGVRVPLVAATALHHLAEHAERCNDLDAALTHLDLAYGRIVQTEGLTAMASDILLPSVRYLRARVLAAMGRVDEALAMIEAAEREHPTFPYAAAALLGARVVAALRSGERALARSLARGRPSNIPVAEHVALLCDLLAAEDGFFEADGEPERIAAALAARPGARAWIERVAPGLTGLASTTTGVRVAEEEEVDGAGGHGDPAAVEGREGMQAERRAPRDDRAHPRTE